MNKKLIDELLSYSGEGGVALATVIESSGSTPRETGARMLIYPDGELTGTIGGGSTEAEVIEEAKKLLRTGGSSKLKFEMTNEDAADAGQICGGSALIFVETLKLF